jgi:hypothetical protein
VAINANEGADKPQRVITRNATRLLWNDPLSNIISWPHKEIIPGSSLLRFFSGIQPSSVGSRGIKHRNSTIQYKMWKYPLSDNGPTNAWARIHPRKYHPELKDTMDEPDCG